MDLMSARTFRAWRVASGALVLFAASGCNLHRRDVGYVQSGIGGGQSVIYPEAGPAAANALAPTPTPMLATAAVTPNPGLVGVAPQGANLTLPPGTVAVPGGNAIAPPTLATTPAPAAAVAPTVFPAPVAVPALPAAPAVAVVPPFAQPAFTFATPTTGSSFVPAGVVLVPGPAVAGPLPSAPTIAAGAGAGLRLQPSAPTPVAAGILPVGFLSGESLAGLRLHPRPPGAPVGTALSPSDRDASDRGTGVGSKPRPPSSGERGARLEDLAPLNPVDRGEPRSTEAEPSGPESADPLAPPRAVELDPVVPPRPRAGADFSEGVPEFPAPGRPLPEPLAPPKPARP